MAIILSESHIRSVVAEAFKISDQSGGSSYSSSAGEAGTENFNINVPSGNYIHPIVKNQDGSTPKFTSVPNPARKNPVDGVVRPHSGYDIGMPIGYPIVSVASGTVVVTRRGSKSAGNYIVIDHGSAIVGDLEHTAYMHLSEILVEKGQKVKQGELIGKSGNTGRSTGPHLHFQIGKGSDSRKHSSDKSQYDAFFAKCNQSSFSKGKLVADKDVDTKNASKTGSVPAVSSSEDTNKSTTRNARLAKKAITNDARAERKLNKLNKLKKKRN